MSSTKPRVLLAAVALCSAGCGGYYAPMPMTGNGQYANRGYYRPPPPPVPRTPYEMACPRSGVAHVRPFHVIVQLTKPNGQPWDGPPNELRRLGCPSFLVNPAETVRALAGFDVGAVGDAAFDAAANHAINVYTGGLVTACGQVARAENIASALLAPFDAPDVFLVYNSGLGESYRTRVYENARPADLTRLDNQLRPFAMPCAFGDSPITVSATDRDRVGEVLTLGMANTDDPIGQIHTSLIAIGPEAICRGYAYIPGDDSAGPSGLVAIGLRIDPPEGADCAWMNGGGSGQVMTGGPANPDQQ